MEANQAVARELVSYVSEVIDLQKMCYDSLQMIDQSTQTIAMQWVPQNVMHTDIKCMHDTDYATPTQWAVPRTSSKRTRISSYSFTSNCMEEHETNFVCQPS